MSNIVIKNQQAVLRIKSPNRNLIEIVRDKLSDLNNDDLRVISGFIDKDKDGVNYYVYINIIAEVEQRKKS